MIEKIKRKEIDKQDNFLPTNFEQLIQKYDLDKIWAYLDNVVDSINADISKINQKISTNIMTAGLSAGVTLTTTGNKILPLDTVSKQIGNNFSLSDGKIIVGAGINYVKISANITVTLGTTSGAKNLVVRHNGTEIELSMNSQQPTSSNFSRSVSTKLIEVSEGDYFELGFYGANGDLVVAPEARTYITVEAVS